MKPCIASMLVYIVCIRTVNSAEDACGQEIDWSAKGITLIGKRRMQIGSLKQKTHWMESKKQN